MKISDNKKIAIISQFWLNLLRQSYLFKFLICFNIAIFFFEYLVASLVLLISGSSVSSGGIIQIFWLELAKAIGTSASKEVFLWLFLVGLLIQTLLVFISETLTIKLSKAVHAAYSINVFNSTVENEPLFRIYSKSVGYYVKLSGDDAFICGSTVNFLLQAVTAGLTTMVSLVILSQFSKNVFFVVCIFLFTTLIASGFVYQAMLNINKKSVQSGRIVTTTFIETLNNIRSIRSIHGTEFSKKTYLLDLQRYITSLVRLDIIKSLLKVVPSLVILTIGVVALTPNKQMNIDSIALFTCTVILVRLFSAFSNLTNAFANLVSSIRAISDTDDFVGGQTNLLKSKLDLANKKIEKVSNWNIKEIIFKDVGVKREAQPVLFFGFDFKFKTGKTYAIVGASGCGKSTFADLLMGFEFHSAGSITYILEKGRSYNHHSTVTLVEQDTKVFSLSLRDNLTFGRSVDKDEIQSVIKTLKLQNMVDSLKDGIDTEVQYLGENFSGGQRQRFGIARAWLLQPQVLIFDEATSALDSANTKTVIENTKEIMKNGIFIFITHDQNTAKYADEIINLESYKPVI